MFVRLNAEPAPDLAAAFRDHVLRLGDPDRHRSDAIRVRIMLKRASRVGLRERLDRAALASPLTGMPR
jgi:hypothetical protein